MQLAFIKTGLAVLDDRGVVCVNGADERGLFLNGADEREFSLKSWQAGLVIKCSGLELPLVELEHSPILFQLFRQ